MSDTLTVEEQLASEEGQQLRAHLADRDWRLDHLYKIKAENGDKIQFVRNEAQRAYAAQSWCRDLIPKARKLGFSTYIAIDILDECLFRGGSTAGIVDRSLDDAVDKLAMIRYAYANIPGDIGKQIRQSRPLLKDNEAELVWRNEKHGNSTVTVGTSYRGGTPTLLHWSEAGKTSVNSPEVAREIMSGGIQAVPISGRVWVESTAHGTSGVFYDMVKRAQQRQAAGLPLSRLDFRLHFFSWLYKREYRVPNNLVVISPELREYFDILQKKHGLKIDADQQAWYASKYEELGPDDIKQEFPSCIAGDVLVATPSGLIPIRDAQPDGVVILKKFVQGVKPVFKLKTALGYEVDATADHPILCSDGKFRNLDTLIAGDEIALQSEQSFGARQQVVAYKPAPFVDAEIQIDERMALFVGLFMGDGSFDDGLISLACDAQDGDLIALGTKLMAWISGGDPYTRVLGSKNGCVEIRISRKALIEPFRAMQIVRQNTGGSGSFKRHIHVPGFIKSSPKAVAASFLRGLFEADGFAQRNGSGVAFFGKDEQFVKDVQLLLLQFGITSRRRGVVKHANGKTYRGCELRLRSLEGIKFSEEIGFLSARKQQRARASLGKPRVRCGNPTLPIRYVDSIASIVPMGSVDVFDITTRSHQFSAGGIVVHNCMEELFFNSILGAYWKVEINKARREQRIGLPVPYDPSRPVDTFWDIGEDCTAIGFRQSDGVRNRVIDYWEEEGSSLQLACGVLDEKKKDRGFVYGKHYGPHDLDNRDWANQAQSRKATALGLGVNFTVVPRVQVKGDSIEAGRRLLNMTWIDEEHAALFAQRCENYRKRWNKLLGVFTPEPVHDINTHGPDAFQQLAMGEKPDKSGADDDGRRRPGRRKRSAWSG